MRNPQATEGTVADVRTNSLPPVSRCFIVDGVLLAPVCGGFACHHPPGVEGPECACGIFVGYAFVALFHWRWGRCLSLYSAGSRVGVCRFIPLEVGTYLSLYSTGGGVRVCHFIPLEVSTCFSLYSTGGGVDVCRFFLLEVGYAFVALFRRRWCSCLSLYSTGGGARVCRFIPLEVGYVFIALFNWRWGTYCRFIPPEMGYVFVALFNWRSSFFRI